MWEYGCGWPTIVLEKLAKLLWFFEAVSWAEYIYNHFVYIQRKKHHHQIHSKQQNWIILFVVWMESLSVFQNELLFIPCFCWCLSLSQGEKICDHIWEHYFVQLSGLSSSFFLCSDISVQFTLALDLSVCLAHCGSSLVIFLIDLEQRLNFMKSFRIGMTLVSYRSLFPYQNKRVTWLWFKIL